MFKAGVLSAKLLSALLVFQACSGGSPLPAAEPPDSTNLPTFSLPAFPSGGPLPPGLTPPATASGASASPAPALVPLPPEVITDVNAVVDAPNPAAAVQATKKILVASGVLVADDPAGGPRTPSGLAVTTEQLELMAQEAQQRATLSRVTLAELAQALGGMGVLPGKTPVPTGQQPTIQISDQPARLAGIVVSWVQLAQRNRARLNPQTRGLIDPPLYLAALAARDEVPVDLRAPFSASRLRLGLLDITLFVAGMRTMVGASGRITTAPSPTAAPAPAATPAAPTRSPGALRDGGTSLQFTSSGATAPSSVALSVGLVPGDECQNVKAQLDKGLFGPADTLGFAGGEFIKEAASQFVEKLAGQANVVSELLGPLFDAFGILFRMMSLALLYQRTIARVEFSRGSLHKPDGGNSPYTVTTPVQAKITAGIPDDVWEKFKKERDDSPLLQALRGCAKFLGLPVPPSTTDIGDAVKNWRVAWSMNEGSEEHALFPTGQFLGGRNVGGRFERPLTPQGDHKGTDTITINVKAERAADHPGQLKNAPVLVCGHVRTDEPPGLGTFLNAGISGSGMGNYPVVGEAQQIAAANAGKFAGFTAAALVSLAASIAEILAGWFQAVVTIDACEPFRVLYHIATPGAWQGTITVTTQVEQETHTQQKTSEVITTGKTSVSGEVTDKFYVGGDDLGAPGLVQLRAHQYTSGHQTDQRQSLGVGTVTGDTGCRYRSVKTFTTDGWWYFDTDAEFAMVIEADGTYSMSVSAESHTAPDVKLPGTDSFATASGSCLTDTGSRAAFTVPFSLTATRGSMQVNGKLDEKNPGDHISGSFSVFNDDLTNTTVEYDLRHTGPIRLPGR